MRGKHTLTLVNDGEADSVQRQGDEISVIEEKRYLFLRRFHPVPSKNDWNCPPIFRWKTREGKSSEGKHPKEGEIWLLMRGSCFSPVQIVFFDS